jgi:hypothetical protein
VRVATRSTERERCAICHGALEADPLRCEGCRTQTHGDCRGALGRCPTLGCAASFVPPPFVSGARLGLFYMASVATIFGHALVDAVLVAVIIAALVNLAWNGVAALVAVAAALTLVHLGHRTTRFVRGVLAARTALRAEGTRALLWSHRVALPGSAFSGSTRHLLVWNDDEYELDLNGLFTPSELERDDNLPRRVYVRPLGRGQLLVETGTGRLALAEMLPASAV